MAAICAVKNEKTKQNNQPMILKTPQLVERPPNYDTYEKKNLKQNKTMICHTGDRTQQTRENSLQ